MKNTGSPSQTPNSPILRYKNPSHASSSSPSRSVNHTPASFASTNRSPSVPQSPNASPSTLPTVAAHGYTPKVGFDTFRDPQASMFSYTLHVQNDGYARTKNTRVYLCAASPDESGTQALDWALDSLVQEGDELIVFRGVDADDLSELIAECSSLAVLIGVQVKSTQCFGKRRVSSCARCRRNAMTLIPTERYVKYLVVSFSSSHRLL
jgi:hypothetical protein